MPRMAPLSAMLSRPVSMGWNPAPTCSSAATRPRTTAWPSVGAVTLASSLSIVVLPEPLRPMMPKISPCGMARSTPRRAHIIRSPLIFGRPIPRDHARDPVEQRAVGRSARQAEGLAQPVRFDGRWLDGRHSPRSPRSSGSCRRKKRYPPTNIMVADAAPRTHASGGGCFRTDEGPTEGLDHDCEGVEVVQRTDVLGDPAWPDR